MKQQLPLSLLLAGMLSSWATSAQSPGGIAPAAWYHAGNGVYSDAGITPAPNNATVQQWNSVVGSFPLLQAASSYRPLYSIATTMANFNPTVTFDGSNDWLQFTAGAGVDIINRESGTIFTAGFVNQQKRSGFAGFHASMDFPGLHVYSNYKLLFFTSGGPGYQGQSADVMPGSSYFTAGTGWQNAGATNPAYAAATVSLNGTRTEYNGDNINNVNTGNAYRDLRIGRDNNYGAFSGQLNEVLVFEDRLSPSQMDQVETYLSIKYGTTFANGTRDHKSSTGATVWAAATNNGYHYNIAGIANDAALYQKQSWSTNKGQQVLIGVGGLANTNADNAGTLSNGDYLIWGDNGMAKSPTVAMTAFPTVSHRFSAIWKVQNNGVGAVRVAWPKGLKSLSLIQSSDATIGAGDVLTGMTSETTINGVVYNYADVTLANGSYFTFAAKVPAPGGVTTGLTQWYRADEGLVPAGGNGSNIISWTDFARGTVSSQIATAPVPVFRAGATNYFNFNPGVNFTAIQQMLGNINTGTLESTNFDIFTLTKEGMTGGTRFFNIGMNNTRMWGDNWDQPGLNVNGTVGTRNSSGGAGGTFNPGGIAFATGIPSIMYHTFTNTSIRKGLNGSPLGSPWNILARGQMTGGHIFGSNRGTNPPQGDDWGFVGNIGEVIIYGAGNLTATERNRVDAYLALKYGITLPAGVNYLNSNADVVWDATANSAYHNNVAGITNDESSALNQKQSISVNSGQQVIIATTGFANTNKDNNVPLNGGQYLVWGDNGSAKVPSVGISNVIDVNYRFASVWKVQNTGSVGTVRVAWPTGLTNLTLLQSTDPTFATVSSSHSMTANTTAVNGVAYNYVDVTLTDGVFFTFAAQLNGPGGVGADLRVWLRSDAGFAPNSWTDFSGNENHYTQTNASRQPSVAERSYNFNPVIDFGGSTAASGRFMVVPSGRPFSANGLSGTFFTVTLTRSGGTSSYRDIWGFGGTTTGTGLTNANSPTVTKLNNDIVLYSSTNSAFSGQYPDNKLLLTDASYTVGVQGIHYGLNGAVGSSTQTRTAAGSLQANGSVLGSQPEVTNGVIGEAIAYERDLTEAEKQRVRTYVAIKYGVTLPHDYIASNATTIFWEQAGHSGYNNNIAGIARDDYGSLNQRQSQSINSGVEVLISTLGLSNSNATNPVMLDDQQALLWGDNGSAKGPTVPIAGISDVNYRFAAVWKVQNTNAVGTVRVAWRKSFANLKLIQSADEIFDHTDIITDMAATQVVNGVEYAYADVPLDNGQYFTFAAFVQGPGGVTNNLSYWYRADKLADASAEDEDVNSWTDFTSGTAIGRSGDNDLPKFKNGNATYFNYNPGLNFTAATQSLSNISVQTVNALNFDIYTLTKEGVTAGSNGRVFSSLVNNTNLAGNIAYWDGIGIMADQRMERVNNAFGSRYLNNPGGTWATTHSNITYNTFSDLSLGKGINGNPSVSNATHSARGSMTGGHAVGSTVFSSNGSDNHGFTGNIGEVIIYGNGNNTVAERNKVESYLAIKYGLTLHNSNNYTTSQDVIVWNASANSGFYNNVAGIGADFNSALEQKQSRSQHPNSNNQVIIALGDIAETNIANTGSLSDGQFLVWGDNGNTQVMTNTASTYTAFEYAGSINNGRRMNRVWKVQNTNNVSDEVLIRFPKASVHTATDPTFTLEQCAAYVMIFADDASFTTNVSYVPVELTADELNYDVRHTFPGGASYFTYGKVIPFNQGTAYLPPVTEVTDLYADPCDIGDWKFFRTMADNTLKLMGLSGYTTTELDNLDVVITPEGTEYDDGAKHTRLMARVATVENGNVTALSSGKVRVYYSVDEMNATIVPSAQTNNWFKYEGDADEVITDVFIDGVFETGKAIALTPDVYGVEDGVNYVEFHNISSFSSFVYLSSTENMSTVLPVTYLHLSAESSGKHVDVSWTTAIERNNKGFEVQHSSDGVSWSAIGFVNSKAINGNSTERLSYVFTDVNPVNGKNFYRLRQVDFDGTSSLSPVTQVSLSKVGNIKVYPNPASSILNIEGVEPGNVVKVFNTLGQEQLSVTAKAAAGQVQLNVAHLADGVYYLILNNKEGEMIVRQKFVKQ